MFNLGTFAKKSNLNLRQMCRGRLQGKHILGDPGAVSRVDKMSVVKVYCKIETSPWAQQRRLMSRMRIVNGKFNFICIVIG